MIRECTTPEASNIFGLSALTMGGLRVFLNLTHTNFKKHSQIPGFLDTAQDFLLVGNLSAWGNGFIFRIS